MGLFDVFKKKEEPKVQQVKKDVNTLANEVIQGIWGKGEEIKKNLTEAGYNFSDVQAKVNSKLAAAKKAAEESEAAKKLADIEATAKEVIQGKWGNGEERVQKLTAAGFNYDEVQNKVNELMASAKKAVEEVAKEVIQGKWGNGEERVQKLTAAGYDYNEVQNLVNKLLAK